MIKDLVERSEISSPKELEELKKFLEIAYRRGFEDGSRSHHTELSVNRQVAIMRAKHVGAGKDQFTCRK